MKRVVRAVFAAAVFAVGCGSAVGFGLSAHAATAAKVDVDFSSPAGAMRPLHGVNNAPIRIEDPKATQHELAAAGVPFVRTHDSAGVALWGAEHLLDVCALFPDFAADENDPKSYDFAITDAYLRPLVAAGIRIFYRLGQTYESFHKVKAYHTAPPADFAKYARVCEHIVAHYNEGWADGFRWNIEYWELWNEPEAESGWSGTPAQFYELYRAVATRLKARFPAVKVGGYGCSGLFESDSEYGGDRFARNHQVLAWLTNFVAYCASERTRTPLDFISWHMYETDPERVTRHGRFARGLLDRYGFRNAENVFDEWNRCDWVEKGRFTKMRNHVGASFCASMFCLMQRDGCIDKAMYYDAMPTCRYCGLFSFPEIETTPCYEAFCAYNELYRLGESYRCTVAGERVYALAAGKGGRKAILIARYSPKGDRDAAAVALNVSGADGEFRLRRIDAGHPKLTDCGAWRNGDRIQMPDDSVVLLLQ